MNAELLEVLKDIAFCLAVTSGSLVVIAVFYVADRLLSWWRFVTNTDQE